METEKLCYFTDNHITVIIIIYRECYDIKRNVRIVYFSYFQSPALFQTSFVFERYLLVLILTRAIIIYIMVIELSGVQFGLKSYA